MIWERKSSWCRCGNILPVPPLDLFLQTCPWEVHRLDTRTLKSLGYQWISYTCKFNRLPLQDLFFLAISDRSPGIYRSNSMCWSQLLLSWKDWAWSNICLPSFTFSDITLVACNHTGDSKSAMMRVYIYHGDTNVANQVSSPWPEARDGC